jgi:CheY-like chemotaxis protein
MLQDSMGNLMANLEYLSLEADQNGSLSSEALSIMDKIIDQTAEKFLFCSKDEFLAQFDFNNNKVLGREDSISGNLECLVVEDNLVNQMILKKSLEKEGCLVSVAANGKEALEKLDMSPDLKIIFMDLQMPVMNGFECTREIRSRGAKDLPIIAVSANSLEEDRELAFTGGVNEFIVKPFKHDRVKEILLQYTE